MRLCKDKGTDKDYHNYISGFRKDMRKMGETAVQQRWWQHSKPCFLYHEDGVYYDELEEIFYLAYNEVMEGNQKKGDVN